MLLRHDFTFRTKEAVMMSAINSLWNFMFMTSLITLLEVLINLRSLII
jgi:hypothetical protein